ncbi:MAG: bis(5'-nucleosyl)-tetraphosphatase (symmetrical) YqeK [Leptospiraceae bacterium]|nr:bis(5'-nucleosyl)-tetraphosphatase (symmetrical) YqeK [Leptospiraceae bacterium]
MTFQNQIDFFKNEILKEITKTRFEHSLRVAKIAKDLSIKHGYNNPEKAYLAGIVHDITKQKKNEFHIEIFNKYNFNYSKLPYRAWHPFSGAIYLKVNYNLLDEEILSAVKNHTLGGSNLNLLDKILYVSDFLGSDYAYSHPELKDWVEIASKDLNEGLVLKSRNIINELVSKKELIHPNTIETYNEAITSIKENHSYIEK